LLSYGRVVVEKEHREHWLHLVELFLTKNIVAAQGVVRKMFWNDSSTGKR
jgi:hypothetical protein